MEETVSNNKKPKIDGEFIMGGLEYDNFKKELKLDDKKYTEVEDAEKETDETDDDSHATTEHRATQELEAEIPKKKLQKPRGFRKELKERVTRYLERTKMEEKGNEPLKPMKGQNQSIETDGKDWEE